MSRYTGSNTSSYSDTKSQQLLKKVKHSIIQIQSQITDPNGHYAQQERRPSPHRRESRSHTSPTAPTPKRKKNSLLLWFAGTGKTQHYIRSLALALTKPKAETDLLETASVPWPSANRLASHNITQVTGQPRNDIVAQNNSVAHTSAASGPWIP